MVQITSLLLATAAVLSAGVSAQVPHHPSPPTNACNTGEFYCGGELLAGQYYDYWKLRIDNALRAVGQVPDGTHESDSLFYCADGTAGSAVLQFDEWCKANGQNWGCQPPQRDHCKTNVGGVLVEKNSCCDVN
ncbi:hypothetical protein N0V85_004435 [Neurospora sp. IMI 360204]|nr:hypothetical protein N0V85_004435 [Neurospora sp. IMI 360204]